MKASRLAIALCAWCGIALTAFAAETPPGQSALGRQIIVSSRPPTQVIWTGHGMPSPWLVSYDGTETWAGRLVQVSASAIWLDIPMELIFSQRELALPWLFHSSMASSLAQPSSMEIMDRAAWRDLSDKPDFTAIHVRFYSHALSLRYWYFPVMIEKSAIRSWEFAASEQGSLTSLP
jgi:hypothetical protein